jgi:hypothetical protein
METQNFITRQFHKTVDSLRNRTGEYLLEQWATQVQVAVFGLTIGIALIATGSILIGDVKPLAITFIWLGIVVALLSFLPAPYSVYKSNREDSLESVLYYAGMSHHLIRKMRNRGADFYSIADRWRRENLDVDTNAWFLFLDLDRMKRQRALSRKVRHLRLSSRDRYTSAVTMLFIGVKERDVRELDTREMFAWWKNGMDASRVGNAVRYSVDSELWASSHPGYLPVLPGPRP